MAAAHASPGLDCWYFDKDKIKRSPSVVDGLDPRLESLYRLEGARFIMDVGTTMGLKYYTKATGIVFLHRFYMFHTFHTFPRYVTACCCLFLAGKVEETPKKCADIIAIAKSLLTAEQFVEFGEDPKKKVITLERIILQTIRFDFNVDLPYYHLINYAKGLHVEKATLEKLVQMAWTFINDSLCTTLCLQWEPEVIAVALLYLATKLKKFQIADWSNRTSKQRYWWEAHVLGLTITDLDDICHQVLDLYTNPP